MQQKLKQMALFSNSEINTGRQMAVDMAKFFSIFFMVIIHTLEGGEGNMDQGVGFFFDSVAGAEFAAPVFMAAMGLGLTFSRRTDAATMLSRGLKLFIAGYLLNIARAIPAFAMVWLKNDPSYYDETIRELTDVDIFQFAGMAFLLLGLLKYLKLNMWWAFGVAVVLSLTGHFVRMVDTGNFWLNLVLSPFIGITSDLVNSDFPLTNWFMFVVAGYGMGKLIRRCTNLDKLFLIVTPIALIVYLADINHTIPYSIGIFGEVPQDFYHMKVMGLLLCLFAIVMDLGLCHFLTKPLSENILQGASRISADITKIYIAQWVIIKWVVQGLMTEYLEIQFNDWAIVGIGIIILIISAYLARVKPLSKLKI